MHVVRKRKIMWLLGLMVLVSGVSALILYAFRQNISLFFTPSQVVTQEAPFNHPIRLGGMVKKGSFVRKEGLVIEFMVTDFDHDVLVRYEGVLPDLFREGQGVVAEGKLLNRDHFQASRILAKHDENYMPPPLKAALNKKGVL